ncbi:MAG: sugar phosphate isomerase/epimerase [Lachnospiraceae bacterium]|nr:sugar phosphate isomerase/epimerase [Lachnospiraceae bacterium]
MNKKYSLTGFADEIADDLSTQIEMLHKLNMHYVEMRGVDGNTLVFHDDDKVREIKKRLDYAGIRLSAVGSPFGKIGIDEPFGQHFDEFKRGVEIAHMMDCRHIRMFSFYIPEDKIRGNRPSDTELIRNGCSSPDADRDEIRKSNLQYYEDAVMERIGRFVDYAKAEDAVLLHENEKGIYGELAPECRKLMDNFYGEHFQAIFDFANFVQARQDTLEAYELLKDYIVYIHVKDAKLADGSVVPAGYGDGHVADILKKLFDRGFNGFLSLEPHLFDFSGFAGLEKDGVSVKHDTGTAMSGAEAFETAYNALKRITDSL